MRKRLELEIEGEKYTICRLSLGEQNDSESKSIEINEDGKITKFNAHELMLWQLYYGLDKIYPIEQIKEMDKVVANELFRKITEFNAVPPLSKKE